MIYLVGKGGHSVSVQEVPFLSVNLKTLNSFLLKI